MFKYQNNRHHKTGGKYFKDLLNFWLDKVFDIEDVKGAIDVESSIISLETAQILKAGKIFGPVDSDTDEDKDGNEWYLRESFSEEKHQKYATNRQS